jgi:hypothetical protein
MNVATVGQLGRAGHTGLAVDRRSRACSSQTLTAWCHLLCSSLLLAPIFEAASAEMSPVHALDRYYLALTLLVTVAYQLCGFAIAWTLQFDKITDFTGGVHMGSQAIF